MFSTEFIYTPPYGSPDGYDVFAKLDRADRILGQRGSGGLARALCVEFVEFVVIFGKSPISGNKTPDANRDHQ